jgi:hypothetical protein
MATNHGDGNGAERNPGVEYDKSDLSARGILIFLFVLAVFAIAIHLAVLGLYVGMTRIAEKHDPETSPLAPQTFTPRDGILTNTANVNVRQFPEPRLLHHVGEAGAMSTFLVQEAAALTARPWQDEHGNVHLPIDQAMKAVVTRLPVRAGGAEVPNYPGAAREYSYPAAVDEAAAEQTGAMQGEAGNSTASK